MGCVWPVGTLVTDRVQDPGTAPALRVVIGEAPGGLIKTALVCPPPWMGGPSAARFLTESPRDLAPVEVPPTTLLVALEPSAARQSSSSAQEVRP